jgi:Ca-activated chloride channel family protein
MNLHIIKIKAHRLLIIFMFTPMLFADVTVPSLSKFIPDDILPFQIIDKANDAYEKGDFRKSISLFKSLHSNDPAVIYDQANAEYKAGMYDEALKHYAQAKGVDEATRLYNMGNSYFKKGDFKLSIKYYTASLRLKSDEDVMHNLKLARKKRKEKEQQKQKDKKKKDKKKEEQKKRDEEKKKQEEQKKKDEKKKQEDKKKNDRKKESDKKNSKSQKDADASNKRESEKKMNPKEKMRKKELSHLIKQLSKKKMPTMMYQAKENGGERHDKNPW